MKSRTITRTCEHCGSGYAPEYGRATRFCSRSCYLEHRWGKREPATCDHCGDPVPLGRRSRKYCTVDCKVAASVGEVRERRLVRYGSGGRYRARRKPEHPYCDSKGYVMEHRLVMEQSIGRYLTVEEVVHHIDENPANNDIANLRLMLKHDHDALHSTERWTRRKAGLPG